MKEALRWLQGIGAGAILAIYEYVKALPAGGEGMTALWHAVVLAALVRVVGWAVSKIPQPAP